ncbi:endonuclease/exonuclease/phosphatase family protein [Tessaracoccus caeni]|uniref:endonuclease/exonuclease/phosphatase family protein n=1 Tax=Tessaracoccus caeni TaxID=3031239 RepID=UPI0023DB147C|nr:endonuclease/exonuclease/phosphatase family protein [Tessaracoccus caeni]MDF1489532.1 endonuclease/exonuclease/phosphatase family protein [Tessaracoccus caeni]
MTVLKLPPSIGVAALLAFAVAYLLGTFAGVANQAWIFGGALAFPLVCTLLGLVGAIILLLLAAAVRPLRTRVNLLSTASMAVVAGILALTLVLATPSLTSPDSVPVRAGARELRSLAWNVHQEDVPAETLVALMAETEPYVVMFAELYSGGDEARFPGGRYPTGYQLVDGHAIAVTLFVSERLGEYRLVAFDESAAYTGIVAEPVDPESESPKIVAVHTTRMTLHPDIGAGLWLRGLDWIAQHCAEPNTIALGDFNAGPANFTDGRLGECQLHSLGTSAPTWPSTVPVPLGATIDHVLATPDWTPTYARTLDVPAPGTDHRPVFSVLTR